MEFATPAYFNRTMYFGAYKDYLRAFPFAHGVLATVAVFTDPGEIQFSGSYSQYLREPELERNCLGRRKFRVPRFSAPMTPPIYPGSFTTAIKPARGINFQIINSSRR